MCYRLRIKVLLIIAGTNDPSNAATLAAAFEEGVKTTGWVTETLRLKDIELEHFSMTHYDPKTKQEKAFTEIKDLVLQSDGVVIATPIWNFSIPAHLKNLIDRIGSFGLDVETRSRGMLGNKPFYFIYTGGTPYPVWKGLMRFTTSSLPESIRYFGGTIAGHHFEPKCTTGIGTFGLVVDKRPESLAKLKEKAIKFVQFADNFKKTGKLPLYYRVYSWCYERGKRIVSKI